VQAKSINTTAEAAAREPFLPNFCAMRMVFAVVITAELLSIVLVLGSGRPASQFWPGLGLVSLYVQWMALAGAAALCILGPWLRRFNDTWSGILAWLILVVIAALVSEIASVLLGKVGQNRVLDPDGHLGLLWKSLGISGIVSALVLRYLHMQHLWHEQVKAESEARLQALQSRIRPHFLFNSMNTIASLTRTRPSMAAEVVQDLADLFRVSLRDASRPSTLGDELEFARRYLNIEHQRLGERLQVDWDLQDLPQEAMMPALVLQPLVENAVYHGIEPATEPGTIRIVGRYGHRRVDLSIFNSLPSGYGVSHRKGNQLALENIRQRLAGVFLGQASLTEHEEAGGFQVRLVFPHPWTEE
jgi:two-component system sensor histidine kinase AlgZ